MNPEWSSFSFWTHVTAPMDTMRVDYEMNCSRQMFKPGVQRDYETG